MIVRYEIAKPSQRVDSLARNVCIDFHRNANHWDPIAKKNKHGSMHLTAIGQKLFPGPRSEILLEFCGIKNYLHHVPWGEDEHDEGAAVANVASDGVDHILWV